MYCWEVRGLFFGDDERDRGGGIPDPESPFYMHPPRCSRWDAPRGIDVGFPLCYTLIHGSPVLLLNPVLVLSPVLFSFVCPGVVFLRCLGCFRFQIGGVGFAPGHCFRDWFCIGPLTVSSSSGPRGVFLDSGPPVRMSAAFLLPGTPISVSSGRAPSLPRLLDASGTPHSRWGDSSLRVALVVQSLMRAGITFCTLSSPVFRGSHRGWVLGSGVVLVAPPAG